MRKILFILLFLAFNITLVLGNDPITSKSLIPKPVSIKDGEGCFEWNAQTSVFYAGDNARLKEVAGWFVRFLKPSTGFDIKINELPEKNQDQKNVLILHLIQNDELGKEGYRLMINKQKVLLEANSPEGVFRGLQTLRQLFPDNIEKRTVQKAVWKIPAGEITDYPVYSYRGTMLDVCRHFFGVEEVKRYIDLMTIYKLNTLHLHLSDDQGWRIEIKSWPKLTEIGGSTQVGGGKGGFYTQEEYKEIVKYAADRFITVVPEIDMPGHTNAALASYPELNCDNKAKELYTGIDVGFSSLCVHKDITYKFVDDVIRELAAITPGEYIHIGGDESHSTKKDDYVYFIEKVQDIVKKHGKKVLGWDEIAHSTIKEGTIVEYWAKDSNAVLAVEKGAQVLMAPASRTYLDMQYNKKCPLGLHWSGYVDVKKAYDWDPASLIKKIGKNDIIGLESPLWTETIKTMDDIEYMAFPRLAGHAEIGWTPAPERSWNEYKVRLGNHAGRFEALDINFYRSPLIKWEK
jgi:hexosaminidase